MCNNAAPPISAEALPSVPHIPAAIVPLSARPGVPADLLAFDVGPSTSLDPFPVPALEQVTLAISTGGEYPVEARVDGSFHRGYVVAGGPGSLSLIPAGLASEWRVCQGSAVNVNLFLSRSLLARVMLESLELDPARLVMRPELFFEDPLLYQLGLAIARLHRHAEPDELLSLDTLTNALVIHLLVQHTWMPRRLPAMRGRLPQPILKRVLDHIESQPASDLRLNQLASLAHLSPYHFARLFTRTLGRPLHQYVLERRLSHACRLLLDTDLALAEVAVEAGFSDESHLLRRFKAHYRMTPSALRKDRKIVP